MATVSDFVCVLASTLVIYYGKLQLMVFKVAHFGLNILLSDCVVIRKYLIIY